MEFPTLARPNLADQYRLTRLPNGLRVITVPLPDRYSVTAAFYVGVGARYNLGFAPLRVDLAVPLDDSQSGQDYAIYISIGQAF